jgi:hypothetical protein
MQPWPTGRHARYPDARPSGRSMTTRRIGPIARRRAGRHGGQQARARTFGQRWNFGQSRLLADNAAGGTTLAGAGPCVGRRTQALRLPYRCLAASPDVPSTTPIAAHDCPAARAWRTVRTSSRSASARRQRPAILTLTMRGGCAHSACIRCLAGPNVGAIPAALGVRGRESPILTRGSPGAAAGVRPGQGEDAA